MRRNDREINDFKDMINIMSECDCCRIGFTESDGGTYIVPMNFG